MPARRPVLSAVAVGALLLGASGCERPSPGVTAVSGSRSVHKDATRYCFGGPEKDCVQNLGTDRVGVLRVKEGQPVAFDVDSDLADHGWFLYDADTKQRTALQDSHYYAFTPDFTGRPFPGIANLEVRSTDKVAENARVTGLWRFQLVLS